MAVYYVDESEFFPIYDLKVVKAPIVDMDHPWYLDLPPEAVAEFDRISDEFFDWITYIEALLENKERDRLTAVQLAKAKRKG